MLDDVVTEAIARDPDAFSRRHAQAQRSAGARHRDRSESGSRAAVAVEDVRREGSSGAPARPTWAFWLEIDERNHEASALRRAAHEPAAARGEGERCIAARRVGQSRFRRRAARWAPLRPRASAIPGNRRVVRSRRPPRTASPRGWSAESLASVGRPAR